ncbi:MAG: hypothetical protein QMD04_03410 [Anaerolineales bacterium]|nr:hypothetical protein [Anaerolineales bacterium]
MSDNVPQAEFEPILAIRGQPAGHFIGRQSDILIIFATQHDEKVVIKSFYHFPPKAEESI